MYVQVNSFPLLIDVSESSQASAFVGMSSSPSSSPPIVARSDVSLIVEVAS